MTFLLSLTHSLPASIVLCQCRLLLQLASLETRDVSVGRERPQKSPSITPLTSQMREGAPGKDWRCLNLGELKCETRRDVSHTDRWGSRRTLGCSKPEAGNAHFAAGCRGAGWGMGSAPSPLEGRAGMEKQSVGILAKPSGVQGSVSVPAWEA